MRKTVLATITAGALALTACTSSSDADSAVSADAGDNFVTDPVTDQVELSEQLDELLLSRQGASGWGEVSEGWGRDVIGTEVNASTLLVHTTYNVNDGRVDDAESIGNEVAGIISGHPAAEQLGRVTVTYTDGRGAYSAFL